jgi:hypothetical protein
VFVGFSCPLERLGSHSETKHQREVKNILTQGLFGCISLTRFRFARSLPSGLNQSLFSAAVTLTRPLCQGYGVFTRLRFLTDGRKRSISRKTRLQIE